MINKKDLIKSAIVFVILFLLQDYKWFKILLSTIIFIGIVLNALKQGFTVWKISTHQMLQYEVLELKNLEENEPFQLSLRQKNGTLLQIPYEGKTIKIGDSVYVLVDEQHPEKSVIVDAAYKVKLLMGILASLVALIFFFQLIFKLELLPH